MNRKRLNYLSYGIILIALTSCRFGNYSDPPKQPTNSGQYGSVELFNTEPVQFETFVIFTDPNTANASNTNTPLIGIPDALLNQFTDPVFFTTPSSGSNASPTFISLFGNEQMTDVDGNGNISMVAADSTPFRLRTTQLNPNCSTQREIDEAGVFTYSSGNVFTFPDQTKFPIAGRLALDYTFIQVFNNCGDDLKALAQCYQNNGGCSSDDLSLARTLFDVYVTRGHVLDLNLVDQIKGLAYTVHFQ